MNDENQDRKTIYAEIAVKVNASAEAVGKRRAVQIAALAAVGHWVQDADGNWHQKNSSAGNLHVGILGADSIHHIFSR